MKKYFLILLVYISGMTSLALEMCASRLLGAYFGTSLFIWGNLIGLILLYLTLGYFLGGRLADRHPSPQLLCTLTAMAALAMALIPFVCQSILSLSITAIAQVSVSTFFSSLLGTLLLFAIPVTLLGLVSPFAIRLTTKSIGASGRISGSLYAVSTVGSILGSFLPVFIFIPQFGVRRTSLETFQQNMSQFAPDSMMGQVASEVIPVAVRARPDGGIVFTDDQAPIEQITDQLLLNYLQQP